MKLGFNNENPWKFYTYIILLTLSLFQGGNSTEWILRKREWDVDHWKEEFDQWKHHKIRPIGHPTTPYQSGDHALHFTLLLLEPMVKMGTLRDHFIGWWTKRGIEPIIYTYNQYIYNIYIYKVIIYIYKVIIYSLYIYIWLYIIQRTRIYSLQTTTNRMGPHHQQLEMGIQAKERKKRKQTILHHSEIFQEWFSPRIWLDPAWDWFRFLAWVSRPLWD